MEMYATLVLAIASFTVVAGLECDNCVEMKFKTDNADVQKALDQASQSMADAGMSCSDPKSDTCAGKCSLTTVKYGLDYMSTQVDTTVQMKMCLPSDRTEKCYDDDDPNNPVSAQLDQSMASFKQYITSTESQFCVCDGEDNCNRDTEYFKSKGFADIFAGAPKTGVVTAMLLSTLAAALWLL